MIYKGSAHDTNVVLPLFSILFSTKSTVNFLKPTDQQQKMLRYPGLVIEIFTNSGKEICTFLLTMNLERCEEWSSYHYLATTLSEQFNDRVERQNVN